MACSVTDPDGRGAFVKPATYNSDVGSGISSQSSSASSPDTSPNITTASRMNGRVETIDTRPKSAPRQRSRRVRVADEATVLDSSSDAGEVPMLVRRASRGNGEILSDHIVFDVPVPSTNRRGSRATTASHGSRSSSPSKSARTKSSPANSAPRDAFKAESRRPSTTPSVPDPLEDAVAAHRQARDAPPPVTQHLVFPTAAVKPKKRAPGKSASGGPGSSDVFPVRPQRSLARPAAAASPAASPVVGALTTASTTGGAFASALTASVARDSTYGLVFPTAASSKRRPTNEKSALKAEGSDLPPWEQEGLDELDWMMAAQTRRPSRRAGDDAEVATEVAVDETDEPGEYGAGEELVDAAQLARQYGEVDDMAADGATADVDAAMELALAQTSMWVLGTIAAHAVGENQRRMSAIGEESDEMEGEGGGVDERDTGRTAPALGVVHPPTPSSLRQSPPAPRLEPPIVLRQPGTRPSAPVESVISDDSDDLRSTPTQPQRTPTQNTTSQRASSPSTPRAPSVTSGRSWSTFGRFNASRLGSLFSSPLGNRQDASPARSGGVSPSASRAAPHLGISSDMVKARMIVAEQQERTRVEAAETEAKEKVLAENARKPRTEESLRFESRLEQFQREERERIKRLAETKRGTAAAAV